MYEVIDRFWIKGRGFAVSVDVPPGDYLGKLLRCGDQTWVIQGVEMMGQKPTAFFIGGQAPVVGAHFTIEPSWPEQVATLRRRVSELESDRARLDDLLARAYRHD